MKETLEWIEKLQTDLDEANTTKATLENQFKTTEDQVANLQCQVQELQSQAQESRAIINRVTELKAEFQETVAWGGQIFVKGQDFMKKELIKLFPIEDFSWIDNIFPKEEDEDQDVHGKKRPIRQSL